MSGLDAITREVERGLQRWCDEPISPPATEPEEDDFDAQVPVHTSRESEITVSGYRYQQCGGGRRVIRKQRRGN
jgi:hypothetical protein